jgi:FixJ family two-component response regulator
VSELNSIIAVIDDDERMCQALSRLLRVAGYDAKSYLSAEAFLDDAGHDLARFVVADIQLPGMSGFDLQRQLQQTRPNLPVALITAHDELETRALATASRCVIYLRKPFPGSRLLNAIELALKRDRCRTTTTVLNPKGKNPIYKPCKPKSS